MRYHYTPIRMAKKIFEFTMSNAGKNVEQDLSFIAGRNAK